MRRIDPDHWWGIGLVVLVVCFCIGQAIEDHYRHTEKMAAIAASQRAEDE